MLIRPHLSPADNRRIQAMLFGNQNGDLRQQLLDGAPFLAELTHTAVPQRAASGTTGTFTRATTATVGDNEGVLRTAIAGEARFEGARRVHNLINTTDSSEVMSVNDITSFPVTIIPSDIAPPSGYTQADRQTSTGALGRKGASTTWSTSVAAGRVLLMQCVAKAGSGRYLVFGDQADSNWHVMTLDTQTGTVNVVGDAFSPGVEDLGDGWFKIWLRFTKNIAGGVNMLCCHADAATNGAYPFINAGEYWWATGFQCEDITGRTDQTTPSEYVSVGAESAPYYHGSFVDGVKCFPTDLAGNPLTTMLGYQAEGARTNLCLQSNAFNTTWLDSTTPAATQNVVGPDGATSAWTIADDDATNLEFKYQPILLTAAAYTASVFVKKTVGTQASYPVFRLSLQAGGASANCTIDTTNGIATAWTAFTGDAMLAGISASCSNYNDDFWRVSLTATATAANYVIILAPAATTNPVQSTGAWVGTVTGSAVFYGAQVELGSFASSYIPTTTAAVTRNADVLTYPSSGNLVGGAYWIYAEAASNETSTNFNIIGRDVTTGNKANLMYVAGDTLRSYIGDGVHGSQSLSAALGSPFTTPKKFVTTGSANSVFGAVSGVVGTQDTTQIAVNFPTNIAVGETDSGSFLFGTIRNLRIGQRQLSASEMQAVTS